MRLINIIEEILVKLTTILSSAFQINYEPVKVKKIPELNVPEIRKTEF